MKNELTSGFNEVHFEKRVPTVMKAFRTSILLYLHLYLLTVICLANTLNPLEMTIVSCSVASTAKLNPPHE
uniref:Transmembrane protein n=1 Tax=Panagrellus redivivus TaxID=6233 RepID=A0A7E4VQB2_PANRE